MYPCQVPKPVSPILRRALIERAAELLTRREPVTIRSLLAGTGASTMAIYTHFGGMPGLWRAVRQEGFTRLAVELAAVRVTRDPIRDVMAFGAAYLSHALAHPDLYRAMFDAHVELDDPVAADAAFTVLVASASRARDLGRLAAHTDPAAVATRFWAMGHGWAMLVINGVLPPSTLADHVPPMATALLVDAGDERSRCVRSVRSGWRTFALAGPAPPGD